MTTHNARTIRANWGYVRPEKRTVARRRGSARGLGRPSSSVLQLASEEPEGGPWRAEPLTAVVKALLSLGDGRAAGSRGVVLAVDGRSSSGKTTLAARMQDAIANSAVVHTDDIAWWHSRFGWADLLINGVLVPFHHGEPVSFRPPRWAEHDRQGSIEVPARYPVLVIEGVGAGRPEVSHLVDALVWVQADQREDRAPEPGARRAARRGADGQGPSGVDSRGGSVPGQSGRPWNRANLLVAGTPQTLSIERPNLSLRRRSAGSGRYQQPESLTDERDVRSTCDSERPTTVMHGQSWSLNGCRQRKVQ